MLVTAGAGTASWTVTRGIDGTTAVAHTSGATVKIPAAPVVSVSFSNVELGLGDGTTDFVRATDGSGTFVLGSAGLYGTFRANVAVDVPGVSFNGNLRVEIDTTTIVQTARRHPVGPADPRRRDARDRRPGDRRQLPDPAERRGRRHDRGDRPQLPPHGRRHAARGDPRPQGRADRRPGGVAASFATTRSRRSRCRGSHHRRATRSSSRRIIAVVARAAERARRARCDAASPAIRSDQINTGTAAVDETIDVDVNGDDAIDQSTFPAGPFVRVVAGASALLHDAAARAARATRRSRATSSSTRSRATASARASRSRRRRPTRVEGDRDRRRRQRRRHRSRRRERRRRASST